MENKQEKFELNGADDATLQKLREQMNRTKELFIETITQMDLQYQMREGTENQIIFEFHKNKFLAEMSSEGMFIYIYDPYWVSLDTDNPDEVSRLMEAINWANLETAATTMWLKNVADERYDVHAKMKILFTPEIKHLTLYLQMQLYEFFRAQEFVSDKMYELSQQAKSKGKN